MPLPRTVVVWSGPGNRAVVRRWRSLSAISTSHLNRRTAPLTPGTRSLVVRVGTAGVGEQIVFGATTLSVRELRDHGRIHQGGLAILPPWWAEGRA